MKAPWSFISMVYKPSFGTSTHSILPCSLTWMFGVLAPPTESPSIVTYFHYVAVRPTVPYQVPVLIHIICVRRWYGTFGEPYAFLGVIIAAHLLLLIFFKLFCYKATLSCSVKYFIFRRQWLDCVCIGGDRISRLLIALVILYWWWF